MIEHCVFCAIRPEVPEAETERIMAALAGLVGRIEGMTGFRSGPNRDFEGKSPGYSHGFICTFRDRAGHAAYMEHPGHLAIAVDLIAACQGGAAGIMVYDIES